MLKAIRVEALTVCYSVLSHLFWTQYIAILISGITTPAIGAFHLHCHPRVLPCTNCTRGTHSGRRLCLAGRHDDDDEKYDDGEDELLMRTLNSSISYLLSEDLLCPHLLLLVVQHWRLHWPVKYSHTFHFFYFLLDLLFTFLQYL